MTAKTLKKILTRLFNLYIKERPFNDNKVILKSLEYFIDYKKNDIVNYLLQFK